MNNYYRNCQVDENCPRTAQITLIAACIEPHLTETRTCPQHLKTLTQLAGENKIWCHCGKQIIIALHKHKHQTTIRNLAEETP